MMAMSLLLRLITYSLWMGSNLWLWRLICGCKFFIFWNNIWSHLYKITCCAQLMLTHTHIQAHTLFDIYPNTKGMHHNPLDTTMEVRICAWRDLFFVVFLVDKIWHLHGHRFWRWSQGYWNLNEKNNWSVTFKQNIHIPRQGNHISRCHLQTQTQSDNICKGPKKQMDLTADNFRFSLIQ